MTFQVDTKLLLENIDGLSYDETKDRYTFKRKNYIIKNIIEGGTSDVIIVFQNTSDPSNLIQVSCNRDIKLPVQDGFNNINLRQKEGYTTLYNTLRVRYTRQQKKLAQQAKGVCKNCGAEFIIEGNRKVFCCPTCAREYQIKHFKETNVPTAIETVCEVCGDTFIAKQIGQKYCCRKCYIKARNARNNEKRKAKTDEQQVVKLLNSK